MTSGVRISKLEIDAFRGISTPITLDFSSPITLVFAPNGTGKTTLCEAAEWLLTGQVERLRDGQHFDPAVLNSKFVTDGREPIVTADLVIGDSPRSLRRTPHDTNLGAAANNRQRVGPGELLALLAPAAAAPDAHHITAISLRQHWLRGTRFLSAEALAALVDTDDATVDRRTQVFADLLGIRHLLDAERSCERYINDLAARERSLAQNVSGQEREATELREALRLLEARRDARAQTSALAELQASERLLSLNTSPSIGDPDEIGSRLEAATAEHGRQQYFLEQRTTAADAVARDWNTRAELEVRVATLAAEEKALVESLALVEEAGRNATSAVEALTQNQSVEEETHRVLIEARDILQTRIATLDQALAATTEDLEPGAALSLAALRDALPEAAWTQVARRQLLAKVRAAISSSPQISAELQRRDHLVSQFETLNPRLLSDEKLANLQAQANAAATVATTARRRLDAAADPLGRLQASGRDFVGHLHDAEVTECPLCGHDWQSVERLREAILSTLSTVPELARLAQSAAAAAADTAQAARARYDEALALQRQGQQLSSDLAAATQAIELRRQALMQLGLTSSLAEPTAALAALERRMVLASALADLLRERDARTASAFGLNVSVLPDNTPPTDARERLRATVAARDQTIQVQIATLKSQLETQTADRNKLRAQHGATQANLRECRAKLGEAMPELDRLRALWSTVALGSPWTPDALVTIRAVLTRQTTTLATVAAHLAAARAAWNAEVRRARLQELDASIAPQQARRGHMQSRIGAAERARATFRQTYTEVSRRQVDDLSRLVNPLFARMQANRVFDQINLGHADDFLHWLADAGSAQMDPGKDFSQGQRQDLALALFLARARSLGGTFFLDEPVAHLDDLNRVGLLDVFRATVMESGSHLNLVVTTASKSLARHLVEKFANVGLIETPNGKTKALRVIELDGNGRSGIELRHVYPSVAAP